MKSKDELLLRRLVDSIRTFEGTVTIWDDSSAVLVETAMQLPDKEARNEKRRQNPCLRSIILEYSYSSQRRAKFTLAKTLRGTYVIEGTLTYPKEFSGEPHIWKKHLENFARQFERKYAGACFFWKMERQGRGAPHFHILVFGIENTDGALFGLRSWCSSEWYRIVGSGDIKHLRAGTSFSRIRHRNGLFSYVSSYLGKNDQHWNGESVGRYWGIKMRKFLPVGRAKRVCIGGRQLTVFNRICRKFAQSKLRVLCRKLRNCSAAVGRKLVLNSVDSSRLLQYALCYAR